MPERGERWKHFKGGVYWIVEVAHWEPDPSQKVVIYCDWETGQVWARFLSVWQEEVAPGVPRFTKM